MTTSQPPLPRIYEQTLILGGGSPATEGRPIAEVGGFWRQPDYGLAYLLAARYVIDGGRAGGRLNEVALPALYLQRHAVELALKDLIGMARDVKAGKAWLEALRSDPRAPEPPSAEVAFTHDLTTLVGMLRTALSDIGYGDVPAEFVTATGRFHEVERSDETRVRYPVGKDRRKSFPDRIVVPVGDLQHALEEAFGKHLYLDPDFQADTLATQLALEQEATTQAAWKITGGP